MLLQCKSEWSINYGLNYSILILVYYFKDDSNDYNIDACFNNTSKTLGQCILDCKDDNSCETDCVSAFKNEHSKCPCQVCDADYNAFQYF